MDAQGGFIFVCDNDQEAGTLSRYIHEYKSRSVSMDNPELELGRVEMCLFRLVRRKTNGYISMTSPSMICGTTSRIEPERLEEVAYYFGHITKKGMPAIQTTVRYTEVNKEQVKEKLKHIKG